MIKPLARPHRTQIKLKQQRSDGRLNCETDVDNESSMAFDYRSVNEKTLQFRATCY